MSLGHALYYPYIHLRNQNWLKYALLFWDKLSRIVPSGMTPTDSDDVIRLRDETGFIEDYAPDTWDVSDAFHRFSSWLEPLLEQDEFLMRRLHRRHFDPDYPDELRRLHRREDADFRGELLSSIARDSGSYVHVQKLDRRLKERLYMLGLAVPGENEWADWVKVDNEIGYTYMAYLARAISAKTAMSTVTDVDELHAGSFVFEPDVFQDGGAQFEYKLANLLIASCVPKDMNRVPLTRLIEVREKYAAERGRFLDLVTELAGKVPSLNSESALKDALNHYAKALMAQLADLGKLYDSLGVETIFRFLNISVPSTALSLSGVIPVEYRSIGIGAGLLIGTISAVGNVRRQLTELRGRPLSYLLNIRSELSASDAFRKLEDNISGIRRWR